MINFEKISIYLPRKIKSKLEDDACFFEVFKRNSQEINFNRFLSNIIIGYYDSYSLETSERARLISETLKKHAKQYVLNNFEAVSKDILQALYFSSNNSNGEKNEKISIRPTSKTAGLLQDIIDNQKEDSISTESFAA